MSAIAMPAVSNPFGPVSAHGGPRLGLIPVAVWVVVVVLAALSDATPGTCHGTGAQLRQQLSYQV
ncbi:MAG TPA: hypothetical protein VMH36_13860 [Alphaproteobacteria bacterium]|nr:hypothetical protein [Alphaproteobacteria bacterium]